MSVTGTPSGRPGTEERNNVATLLPGGKTKPLPPLPNQTASPEKKDKSKSHVSFNTDRPSGKPNGQDQPSVQHQKEKGEKETQEKENESPSTPPKRPISLELNNDPRSVPLVQSDKATTPPLQRYSKPSVMKEKGEKWKERRSEIVQPEKSTLEHQRMKSLK